MKTIPNYHPPSDYRRPTKTQEKVYVPVNDYPEINFSMITNPLTPNHSCVVYFKTLCSSRARKKDIARRCLFGSLLANPCCVMLNILSLLSHFFLITA